MAQQGSGLGKGPDPAMEDQTSYSGARDGAAKRTQKQFDTKWGMKDQTKLSGIGPDDPGKGPVAGGASSILDPETPAERGKVPRRTPAPGEMKTPWGQVDANGKGLDTSIGGKVIGEAILSGAGKLPSSESYGDSKPVRQPG